MAVLAKLFLGSVSLVALSVRPMAAAVAATGAGQDPTAVARALNDLYYGYDGQDSASPVGVTMNWPVNTKSFYRNIFCAEFNNPLGRTGCSGGGCDCRLSAALHNHRMLITENHTLMNVMARRVAIVFNQTLVEQYMSRCFYVWDGATDKKYNVGCGLGAGGGCSSPNSAFANICPNTGKVCTAQDPMSVGGTCAPFGGHHPMPPSHSGYYQCSFPGPAVDFHNQSGWQPTEARSNLRQMVDFRLASQAGSDEGTLKIKMWNEVVMDVRLMMPRIAADPASVVSAFTYWKDDRGAKATAKAMRDDFCATNHMTTKIPLLALDGRASTLSKEPIFLALPEEDDEVTVVI